jgi:transposase
MVFEDETGFTLHPRLGMGWAKKGQRLRIPTTSQHHKRLNLFGWVAPLLGRKGLLRQPQGNREGFVNCLKHLYRRLKGYTVWLYVDRAKWHRGEEVELFVKTHVRLRLKYLPSYQPSLNMEERIWRQVRYDMTTNHWFESLEAIWETVHKTVLSWSPKKIKQLCKPF